MSDVLRQLERDASSADPKAIRALRKARVEAGQDEGRDPSLYPWAGDRWRRMHWTMLVLDPCVTIKEKRFVRISEGFAAKNEKGRPEASRDSEGRRIPAVQKNMPWAEWLWLTGTGGYPQPMRPYQKNNTPAECFYKVVPAEIVETPVPPPITADGLNALIEEVWDKSDPNAVPPGMVPMRLRTKEESIVHPSPPIPPPTPPAPPAPPVPLPPPPPVSS